MKCEATLLFKLIRDFLVVYLPTQRALSPNTIKSYRSTLNLFLGHIKERRNIPIEQVTFQDFTKEYMGGFLKYLEETRGSSVATRNQRLAGIRAFCKYAAGNDVALVIYYQNALTIPVKKEQKSHTIEFFSEGALKSILEQPDTKKRNGLRDFMFMLLLYDTGARIQELLDLRLDDIRIFERSPYVVITGKGGKTRLVPLMEKTAGHLKRYLNRFHEFSNGDDRLFYTMRKGGRKDMSPDNAAKFIRKYGALARSKDKEVPENLHAHLFRHTRSMHLYRNGMPLPLLSEWLGHVQMETTLTYYANADTKMKREAIEKATSEFSPLVDDGLEIDWANDEDLVKRLYGLA
jgi:site-specific recombinase XerD